MQCGAPWGGYARTMNGVRPSVRVRSDGRRARGGPEIGGFYGFGTSKMGRKRWARATLLKSEIRVRKQHELAVFRSLLF